MTDQSFEFLKKLFDDKTKELNNSIMLNFELVLPEGGDKDNMDDYTVAVSHLAGDFSEEIPEELINHLYGITIGLKHGYTSHQDKLMEWCMHESMQEETDEIPEGATIN